jgi:hypothetical protein
MLPISVKVRNGEPESASLSNWLVALRWFVEEMMSMVCNGEPEGASLSTGLVPLRWFVEEMLSISAMARNGEPEGASLSNWLVITLKKDVERRMDKSVKPTKSSALPRTWEASV